MRNKITKSIQYGEHTLTIETGHIATQASGSVMVSLGDTTVLVAAVGKKDATPGRGFFPLTVNYQEKTYAAGKIPGGFFKREGRPNEFETLTSRLIDRPIRPLFPKSFLNEVQIIATVVSLDPKICPDIPALIGASAALALSGMPFKGPVGAARVGYTDGIYTLNPDKNNDVDVQLNLVVAGTKDAVLMVESEAKELSEEVMLGAVLYGHEMMQSVIDMISELTNEIGVEAWEWVEPPVDTELEGQVKDAFLEDITKAYQIVTKQERVVALQELKVKLEEQFKSDAEGEEDKLEKAKALFSSVEKNIVRQRIISGQSRIDGRDTKTVRPISIETGILKRAHGSALFTRGETQALVVATLGTDRDAQLIDAIDGERRDRFMLHYNFPPYCVGEVGMQFGPKRREIGHGRLARRATEAVLPSEENFPYVIRVVSEITESNGSSSMASVCGTSLALMDAGVPIKAPVSGVAMGLIKEGEQFAILTDILGDEDHLGDMDFKVAGTQNGITALQMDIKIDGITKEIMEKALEQARDGRLHILSEMNRNISTHREAMSEHAPRIYAMKVAADKIREVIGKGGATIRALTEETGATIDIEDDGSIKIFSVNEANAKEAMKRIEEITAGAVVGQIYDGEITKIVDFGAFVRILPGKEGLLHISQISEKRIDKVTDVLSEGQKIQVKVLDVDRQGRIKLSMKEVATTETANEAQGA